MIFLSANNAKDAKDAKDAKLFIIHYSLFIINLSIFHGAGYE